MAAGTATGAVYWRVADVTARNALVVLPEEVGKLCQVQASGILFMARSAGTGAALWADSSPIKTLSRTFARTDVDVAVAAHSAVINLGSALPIGAIVMAVYANVTVAYTDGATGVFSADVGVASGDDDRFTPTALDIDGGVAELTQSVLLPASGTQLAVTIASDVNLSTLTAGSFALKVVYFVPTDTAG